MFLITFLKGVAIGIANIIPGVSGGTIAVVLDVFDELIDTINNLFKDFKGRLKFLVPIALGVAVGIIGFGALLEYLLERFSFPTCMFFVGLVVGSIPLIIKKATEKQTKKEHGGFELKFLPLLLIGIASVVLLSFFQPAASAGVVIDPAYMLYLFVCGAIASAAMIVPGISGSFVMILLGVYPVVLETINGIKDYLLNPANVDLLLELFKVLIPVGLGVLLGIALISKLINFLFKRFYTQTYYIILGLMIGSVYGLLSDPTTHASGYAGFMIPAAVLSVAAGTFLALKLGKRA